MTFIQPCFIRKNTPELRQKLAELGYSVCVCTSFKDAVWLDTATHTKPCSSHGIGFWDETCDCEDVEGACRIFLEENKKSLNPKIDCGTNEEMFLALAALRDDTDYMQWFICGDNESMFKVDKPDMSVEKYIHEYMEDGIRKDTVRQPPKKL